MKIAFLAQSYPPMISGAALVVQQLAHGMVARGHEVLVIAASDTGQAYLTQEPHLKGSEASFWGKRKKCV